MKILAYIITLAAGLLMLAGCSADTPDPGTGSGGDVTLLLRVGINNPRTEAARTRSEYPDGYPYEFEEAATVYEGINTLRVIIVDAAGDVEHNEIWQFGDHIPVAGDLYGDMTFKVKGGEKKRIYLIANEASVQPAVDFTQYVEGTPLAPATAEAWTIYSDWSASPQPYINNNGTDKKYVPMTEYFDVQVQEAASPAPIQSETLFVSRSVVKFSFYLDADGDLPESFRISSMTFNSVMQKGYLMPNTTTYLPAKYPLTENTQRIVTTFTTPGFSNNKISEIIFNPSSFGMNAAGSSTTYTDKYIPQYYFCETQNNNPGNAFYVNCTVVWGGDNDTEETMQRVQLPNLPSFPRNTHVKVYMTMRERELTAHVILMPYIGVWLNPSFGIGGSSDDEEEGQLSTPSQIHPLSTQTD